MRITSKRPVLRSLTLPFVSGLVLLLAMAYAHAHSGDRHWVRRYDGGLSTTETAVGITADARGNVYVVGDSTESTTAGADIITVKYSSTGRRSWVRRYNGPSSLDDHAKAITRDRYGNVFVVGSSEGTATGSDYLILKYDRAGRLRWARRLDGPGHGKDEPNGLVVDRWGYAHVTGISDGESGVRNLMTVKYNPTTGRRVWARPLGTNGHHAASTAFPAASRPLVVDPSGNVYVTGSTGTTPPLQVLVKYSREGRRLWSNAYRMPGSIGIRGWHVTRDRSNRLYVAGTVEWPTAGDTDIVLTKCEPKRGKRLWVRRYNGGSRVAYGMDDEPSAGLAIDHHGNVYVGGFASNANGWERFVALKYNSHGRRLWARSYVRGHHCDRASDLAVDAAHNVYLTGTSLLTYSSYDYQTLRIDAGGRLRWLRRYDGAYHRFDFASGIAAVPGGVYVTGTTRDGTATATNVTTIKYTP